MVINGDGSYGRLQTTASPSCLAWFEHWWLLALNLHVSNELVGLGIMLTAQ